LRKAWFSCLHSFPEAQKRRQLSPLGIPPARPELAPIAPRSRNMRTGLVACQNIISANYLMAWKKPAVSALADFSRVSIEFA
jgi:hypothetical protein